MQLRFEGAVAGVVPVIRVLQESLAGAHVERIHGIVNGTTNFILTEMARAGATYESALQRAQELGYAEADPTDDVTGRDAAAKMAILARLAFSTPVHLDQVTYEGIEHITPEDVAYARDLGLGLKLIGTAERVDGGISVRVHPAFLYPGHPLASVNGSFNAVTVESDAITEITLSGPGAGGSQTASSVLGDVISAMIPPASTPETSAALPIVTDVENAFYLSMEVDDQPGVLAQVAEVLGMQGASIKSVLQRGLGAHARLTMVLHPLLESRFYGAVAAGLAHGVRPLAATRDPGHRGGVRIAMGLITRYRERLPFAPGDPVVSLEEGSTPLVLAERVSERAGVEVWLKLEGANPTGSFKDRGMTCAVSDAVREGIEAVICASTGNTAAAPPPTPRAPGCAAR